MPKSLFFHNYDIQTDILFFMESELYKVTQPFFSIDNFNIFFDDFYNCFDRNAVDVIINSQTFLHNL